MAGAPPDHQRDRRRVGRGQDRAQGRGQRVPGDPQVPLVSGARNLRPRDFRTTEGAQGDVRGQDGEEQDNQLRAWGQGDHLMPDGV